MALTVMKVRAKSWSNTARFLGGQRISENPWTASLRIPIRGAQGSRLCAMEVQASLLKVPGESSTLASREAPVHRAKKSRRPDTPLRVDFFQRLRNLSLHRPRCSTVHYPMRLSSSNPGLSGRCS